MLSLIEEYYLKLEEPRKSVNLAIRDIILNFDDRISEEWKFGMPFFYFNGKMFCYIWRDPKTRYPYIGFNRGKLYKHADLLLEKRKSIKVLHLNPDADLPIKTIYEILEEGRGIFS